MPVSLDVRCRMDVCESKQMSWDWKEHQQHQAEAYAALMSEVQAASVLPGRNLAEGSFIMANVTQLQIGFYGLSY